jgi:hypothetical protein
MLWRIIDSNSAPQCRLCAACLHRRRTAAASDASSLRSDGTRLKRRNMRIGFINFSSDMPGTFSTLGKSVTMEQTTMKKSKTSL